MTGEVQIVFLIPSYQPAAMLCDLLAELRRASPFHIVVVDDGSGADFAPVFQKAQQVAGTTLLANAVNLGKGAALKHGMKYILVHHPDCAGIVTAGADRQHAVADILSVADELRKNPAMSFSAHGASILPFRCETGSATPFALCLSVSDRAQVWRYPDRPQGIPDVDGAFASLSAPIDMNSRPSNSSSFRRAASRSGIPIETIYIDSNRDRISGR